MGKKREAGKYTRKKVNSSKDAPKNHKKTYHYLPKNTYTACECIHRHK